MPNTLIINGELVDIDNLAKLMLVAGSSYYFGGRIEEEGFWTSISTSVTADPGARLFAEIIESNTLPVNPLPVAVFQDWENTLRDLNPTENEEISDEAIILEMIEHDFIVRMPPVREYTLRVKVKSVEKGIPHVHLTELEGF
jgi:hypothetical protein